MFSGMLAKRSSWDSHDGGGWNLYGGKGGGASWKLCLELFDLLRDIFIKTENGGSSTHQALQLVRRGFGIEKLSKFPYCPCCAVVFDDFTSKIKFHLRNHQLISSTDNQNSTIDTKNPSQRNFHKISKENVFIVVKLRNGDELTMRMLVWVDYRLKISPSLIDYDLCYVKWVVKWFGQELSRYLQACIGA